MLLVDVGEPETEEAGEDEGEAEAEPPDDVQAAPLPVIFFDDDDACGVFFEDDEDLFGL